MAAMHRWQTKAPQKNWSEKGPDLLRRKDQAIEVAKSLAPRKGPYYFRVVKPAGPTPWVKTTWGEGMEAAMRRATDRDMVQVATGKDKDICAELRLSVIRPYTGEATNAISDVVCLLREAFPNHNNLGVCACRRIGTSTTWSQHAYCNGYDAGGSTKLVKDMGDWCVRMTETDNMACAEVICDRRIWQGTWSPYGGDDPHDTHIHVSGAPLRSGVPKCA